MMSSTLVQILFIPLLLTMEQRNTASLHIHTPDKINFVVTNREGCTIALPPTATLIDLRNSVAESCNVSFHFELQMVGETIVSTRPSTNQSLGQIPDIVSMAETMHDIWGSGFRIPLRIYPVIASEDDLADYITDASVTELYDAMAESYNVSFPFELRLMRGINRVYTIADQ